MGMILCNTHGLQFFFEVCEHVAAALQAGSVLPRRRILQVAVCEACESRYELSRFTNEVFTRWTDAAEAQYLVLNATSECYCLECIAAVELSFARARAEPDPFPAYERTLTFLQLETVERLEKTLLAAFEFRQSVAEPRQRAVWVNYGAVTQPLEITIYYVTDRAQQDAILQWLERFFADIPQRQRRVLFYRAENWQEDAVTPPAIRGWSRSPEELVRKEETDPPSPAPHAAR